MVPIKVENLKKQKFVSMYDQDYSSWVKFGLLLKPSIYQSHIAFCELVAVRNYFFKCTNATTDYSAFSHYYAHGLLIIVILDSQFGKANDIGMI